MSYILLIMFLNLTVYRYIRKKTTISLIMGWIIFSPYIQIGKEQIDSSYIVAIVFFITILLFQRKIKMPPKLLRGYLLLLININIVYLIAWMMFSRNDSGTLISSLAGALKIFIIIIECWIMNSVVDSVDVRAEISKMIAVILVLNLVFIIYEMIDFVGSRQFLLDHLLSYKEQSYLKQTTKWGYYNRYYGVFHYPMHMGIFMTYAIAYLIGEDKLFKKWFKLILLLIACFLGIMSASKSFMIGTAGIITIFISGTFMGEKIKVRKILMALSGIFMIVCILIFFEQIYDIIYTVAGPNFARCFNFLRNFSEIFETRFNSETGALREMIICIKKYWLIGVGPSNIMGEEVMDNAYLMVMHNGGIVSLVMVMLFYIKLILNHVFEQSKLVLVFATIIMGMGFQTLLAVPISTWIIYELCTEKYNSKMLY